jgi:glycosyltransferase involved in cell wall biosynthesis/tetratricopeptide (TPR) repeat protein
MVELKISALWITKNEEKNILRSINSVRDAVDELIVVDTGSDDSTERLCREAGARVEYFKWINDFSAAKNYAAGLAAGEIIIFLDADEWFTKALTVKDRAELQNIFKSNPRIGYFKNILYSLDSNGSVISVNFLARIWRAGVGLSYRGKIHEMLDADDKSQMQIYEALDKWQISHSGYAETIMETKYERNIQVLKEVIKAESDPEARHMYYCYLLRESNSAGNKTESLNSLKAILQEPSMIRMHYQRYKEGFLEFIYKIIDAAAINLREGVSRAEVYNKAVNPVKKMLSGKPDGTLLGLYYEVRFALKEDSLLKKIPSALKLTEKTAESSTTNALYIVCVLAAKAAYRRGNKVLAADYAVQAVKLYHSPAPEVLHILLNCLRGKPVSEIVLALNSLFDTNDTKKLIYLFQNTRLQGFRDVHAFYLKKYMEQSGLTQEGYIHLFILFKKYTEALILEKKHREERGISGFSETAFIAVLLSGDVSVLKEYEPIVSAHADILEAYFTGRRLETVSDARLSLLESVYPQLAFIEGINTADSFAALFPVAGDYAYLLRTRYCIANGMYEEALNKDIPDTNNHACSLLRIQALSMLGRYDEALAIISNVFAAGYADGEYLAYLLVISENAAGTAKAATVKMYGEYMPAYDKLIDLRDVINTGYADADANRKETRLLKTITYNQFKKQYLDRPAAPRINGLAEVCGEAAVIYEEKGMYFEAMDCLLMKGNSNEALKILRVHDVRGLRPS